MQPSCNGDLRWCLFETESLSILWYQWEFTVQYHFFISISVSHSLLLLLLHSLWLHSFIAICSLLTYFGTGLVPVLVFQGSFNIFRRNRGRSNNFSPPNCKRLLFLPVSFHVVMMYGRLAAYQSHPKVALYAALMHGN